MALTAAPFLRGSSSLALGPSAPACSPSCPPRLAHSAAASGTRLWGLCTLAGRGQVMGHLPLQKSLITPCQHDIAGFHAAAGSSELGQHKTTSGLGKGMACVTAC